MIIYILIACTSYKKLQWIFVIFWFHSPFHYLFAFFLSELRQIDFISFVWCHAFHIEILSLNKTHEKTKDLKRLVNSWLMISLSSRDSKNSGTLPQSIITSLLHSSNRSISEKGTNKRKMILSRSVFHKVSPGSLKLNQFLLAETNPSQWI